MTKCGNTLLTYHHIGYSSFDFPQRNNRIFGFFGFFIKLPNMEGILTANQKYMIVIQ